MSQWAEVRHLHDVQSVPKREIARRLQLDVKTVRRALAGRCRRGRRSRRAHRLASRRRLRGGRLRRSGRNFALRGPLLGAPLAVGVLRR